MTAKKRATRPAARKPGERKPARLGRPPASSSAETRARILSVAREAFGVLGYGVTTNKYVATKAGITTGALYHYFDSKTGIYAAVYRHVTEIVFDRFDAAIAGADTFLGRFEAVLEEAHRLDAEDPSLARFLGSARVDVLRHDEIRPALASLPLRSLNFRRALIEHGVKTGEIRAADKDKVFSFVQIVLVGLTDAVSGDSRMHRVAVDSIKGVLEGRLLSEPRSVSRRDAGAKAGRSRTEASPASARPGRRSVR